MDRKKRHKCKAEYVESLESKVQVTEMKYFTPVKWATRIDRPRNKKSAEEIEIKTIELAVKLTHLKWFGTEQLASGQNELRNLLECVRQIRLVKELTCTRLILL